MTAVQSLFPLSDAVVEPQLQGAPHATTTSQLDPEAMTGGLPRGTLRGDEAVILVLRPSRWFILLYQASWIGLVMILAILVTIAVAALSSLGIVSMSALWLTWIIAAGITAALIVWAAVERRFRVYVLTTDRVLTTAGVIRRSIYETSLVNLRQTLISVSILERCTGIGSLLFATAGTAFYDTAWIMLADPGGAQRQVQSMIRRATRSKAA
ncbi:MAG: PH domain-containing protein [Planctomycetota bacterium]|nr:PH domain-containing protein [Planctomycetota bacterium]